MVILAVRTVASSAPKSQSLELQHLQDANGRPILDPVLILRRYLGRPRLEEDKRATTNVQNGVVFFFLFL